MKRKIIRSMMILLALALTVSYALLTAVYYFQSLRMTESELMQEAEYVTQAVGLSGISALIEMDKDGQTWTRKTLIDDDGTVLYDSWEEPDQMGNHRDREEVVEALENGSGKAIRQSDTLGRGMFYYAVQMKDGKILRVARDMSSIWLTAGQMFPYMIVIGLLLALAAWIMAKHQVNKLVKPINELDLEKPLEGPMYEELVPFLERLDKQNHEKGIVEQMRREFSANVSHELKTPLTSISGYAEIMMNGLVRPEDIPNFSERIYKEANRMITLVEDIIKLSRLDEGSIELEKEDVDFYDMAREISNHLALKAEKKHVGILVSGEHVIYHGIRQILDEMLYNICENAVKYNIEGGYVTIWTGHTPEGRKVVIEDTGIGIPKEHQERVFERFYRVDKSHSRETGGTGLGLSIVKHGALLHGADIHLDSEPGEGTRIEINFH
ncbi:MAG TPA: two-component sensor histidine kinase [Candidatus Onthocola gallistercoris]|uniref:histidine kinase n=1 Tax=Candidatus Onthocola gallistercoris TaxID=2840876 RepID=A0A9D1HEP9_9FIRM|nr:two-component sensor histidine kinase [Candidatus Onthocola gallistercoris]